MHPGAGFAHPAGQAADCAKVARGAYRSYSKEDIERTGETDMAEALRKLDPAFR